jgi:hypothetical protein
VGLTPGNARHRTVSKRLTKPIQLECLACGSVRVAYGYSIAETGQCPRCSYVGWTYAEELDGWTTRMILNGKLEGSQPQPSTTFRPTRLAAQH